MSRPQIINHFVDVEMGMNFIQLVMDEMPVDYVPCRKEGILLALVAAAVVPSGGGQCKCLCQSCLLHRWRVKKRISKNLVAEM